MNNIQFNSGAIVAGDCISNGWNLVKPNYWMYFGICLLAILLISCIPCVNFVLMGPVLVGVYYVLLKDMRSESVDLGMMFKGFEKFVPAMVVGLIQGLPGIVWTIVDYSVNIASLVGAARGTGTDANFYQADESIMAGFTLAYVFLGLGMMVLSVFWGVIFIFALPLLAENQIGPIEALSLSARAALSNAGGLILLIVLQVLIAIAGVLALCLGVFFVIPIIYAATAFAYRQVFPPADMPQVNVTPPPPGAYGGGYGQPV